MSILTTDTANTYQSVPGSTGTDITHYSSATNGVTTTVVLGTKVDNTQPAGTYTTTINFVATANANTRQITDLIYMQDFKNLSYRELTEVKDSMTVNSQYQLIDKRDNSTYWLAKLQTSCQNKSVLPSSDSKCYQIWMTQNLDFSLSTSTRLNSTNTDLNSAGSGIYTDGYTVGIDGTIYYTPSVSTVTNVAQTSNQDTTPQSYDPGTVYYYQGSTAGSPAASSTCTGSGDTCKHWHAGNYYNWNAAVASNNSAGQTTQTHATNSVCPAGWQLPSANDNIFGYSDLNTLFVQQNIVQNYVNANTNAVWTSNGYNDIQGAPLYFTRIGSFSSSTLNSTATNGLYIANLLDGSKKAYNLFFNNSQLQPSSAMGAANGIAVRCIVRDPIYMQEVTTSQLAALMPSSGNSVKLTDERDGKAYTVTNINGSYWMTQNLNLTTAATSSLSNFTGPGFNPCSGDLLTGNSVDEARCHTSGDTTYGTWYNYYSATAGTISTDNSAENATQDICPSGWRLPTNSEFSSITSYASTFSPVVGGRYINGTLEAAYGYWWSSTVASGYNRYALRYIGSSMASQVSGRSDGLYIRCLKS